MEQPVLFFTQQVHWKVIETNTSTHAFVLPLPHVCNLFEVAGWKWNRSSNKLDSDGKSAINYAVIWHKQPLHGSITAVDPDIKHAAVTQYL